MDAQKMVDQERRDLTLPFLSRMSEKEIAQVLYTYCVILRRYFLLWLALAMVRSETEVARQAARRNLLCELSEDHDALLLGFATQIPDLGQDTPDDLVWLADDKAKSVTHGCHGVRSGAQTVIALLENLSVDFIPWMTEAAQRLNFTDLSYLEKHGRADVAHAAEFVTAVDAELKGTKSEIPMSVVDDVRTLLKRIFNAHTLTSP